MPSKNSTKDRDSETNASVLDILYADFRRIEIFTSQLNELGNLTSITQTRQASRGTSDDVRASGKANALVASGEAKLNVGYRAEHSEASQRNFDPRWNNTLGFLDAAQSRGLLTRDADNAAIGQIIVASGALKVRDLDLIGRVWGLKSVKAFAKGPQPNHTRKGKSNPQHNTTRSEIDLMLEIMEVLPRSLQATITGEKSFWTTLDPAFLLVSPADFVLKHGSTIEGEWGMVGILDARPGTEALRDDITNVTELHEVNDVLLSHILPITRQLLGRPANAFGVTPLVIYREIGRFTGEQ